MSRREPFRAIAEWTLNLLQAVSLHRVAVGRNPEKPAGWYARAANASARYAVLHDVYILLWLLAWAALLFGTNGTLCWTFAAGLIALYRIAELLGAVIYVLIYRTAQTSIEERSLLLSSLAYVEVALWFGVVHASIAALMTGLFAREAFGMATGVQWAPLTALHLSFASYTTVGWGDVYPKHWLASVAVDVEAVVGVFMLAVTISGFVSRASGGDSARKGSG